MQLPFTEPVARCLASVCALLLLSACGTMGGADSAPLPMPEAPVAEAETQPAKPAADEPPAGADEEKRERRFRMPWKSDKQDAEEDATVAATDTPLAAVGPEVDSANQRLFDRALVLIEDGSVAAAEVLLQEITVDQPELAGPWFNLALLYTARDADAAGQEALEKAVAAKSGHCPARTMLGVRAREAGDFAAAEAHYLACLAARPGFPPAQLNLGILYELYMGRYSEALAAYQDYQLALAEPDPKVNGWLVDLERRVAALAQR